MLASRGMRSVVVPFLFAATSVACAYEADTAALRTRAAFDFECPASSLRVYELRGGEDTAGSGAVYGVTGCGRRGTYVNTRLNGWILNSDSEERGSRETRASRQVEAEEAAEESIAQARPAEPTQCQSAFNHVGEFAAIWADWYQGKAVTKLPAASQFKFACTAVNDDVQVCMVAPYAKSHRSECIARFQTLPETRAKLDQMLLEP
jgi:hypothetical protein